MIGNDIVDLNTAKIESNWLRKGYVEKIFTPEEQLLIDQSKNKDTTVWLLWSMKEAAYKIINRQLKRRFYTPLAFCCTISNAGIEYIKGYVSYRNQVINTKSKITDSYIHSMAIYGTENFNGIYSSVKNDHDYFKNNYDIFKDKNGLPFIVDQISKEQKNVSLSHHGNYASIML